MSPGSVSHLPGGAGGGDDEEGRDSGNGGGWLIAGVVAAVVAFLLLLAAPAVIVHQNTCEPGAAEGIADSVTLEQVEVAARIVQVGEELRRSQRHILAALATGYVESELRNLPPEQSDNDANPNKVSGGSVSSVGVFQQQNFLPWTKNGRNRMNVRDASRTFYEEAERKDRPGYTIGNLAQAVQGSAYPHKYDLRVGDARAMLARVRDGGGSSALATVRVAQRTVTALAARVTRRASPRATAAANPTGTVTLAWPTEARTLSSPFGPRPNPCPGCSAFHEGLDIAAPNGAPVHAAASGQVVLQGTIGGYGNYVCIRHQANFATCYAHLGRFGRQAHGTLVRQGQVIGYVGNTGVGTGAHLHFEVRLSGSQADPAVDPKPYLDGAGSPASVGAGLAADDCGDGGAGLGDGDAPTTSGPAAELKGKVVAAPASAPGEVRRMIAAGNAIQHLTYTYGGGHNARYKPSPGFDCSATVSYVLWKAGLLKGPPLVSGGLARWGAPGRGKWVTIWSHPGHTFIEIAGQRLDTSPHSGDANSERGPRWRGSHGRSTAGFTPTHPPGL